jgi:hypothetical protein
MAQAFAGSISSTLFLAAALLASVSCATEKAMWAAEPGEPGTAAFERTQSAAETPPNEADRLIARTAYLSLEVADLASSVPLAEAKARELGALVVSSTLSEHAAAFVLRVPALKLDAALASLAALGKVQKRELNATDVTESVADLEARLVNQQALRERLRAVLARGTNVEELLAVERELARVQTEIDQLDGQLTRLRASVAMSTISLTLQAVPEPEQKAKPRILGPLGAAWWAVKKLWVVRE